jgi:hypothetical protein
MKKMYKQSKIEYREDAYMRVHYVDSKYDSERLIYVDSKYDSEMLLYVDNS